MAVEGTSNTHLHSDTFNGARAYVSVRLENLLADPRIIEQVARRLYGEPNSVQSTKTDLRFGTNGSLSVDLGKGTFYDHENEMGGGLLDLINRKVTGGHAKAYEWLAREGFLPDEPFHRSNHVQATNTVPKRRIAATYDYVEEQGQLLHQAVRFQPKGFSQRRHGDDGRWVWNVQGIRIVPYRLPEIIEGIANEQPIFVVEGEKDADNLSEIGIIATCNAGGAGKWKTEHAAHLKGADVIIIPDNDDAGQRHAESVAHSLFGVASRVRVLELRGLPSKGDVTDWLEGGGTAEQLWELVAGTSDWMPAQSPDAQTDGAALLDQTRAFLGRFVAYPSEHACSAHALWVVHAHIMDAWESTPRIAFLSAEPGSGKTRALEVTESLVPFPVEAVNVTPAYLFRKVADPQGRPTILYDEIDTVFGPKAKDNEEIRGLLNAGHRRGAVAGRCVVKGKQIETEEIPAYCAVALAGLGALPDTILSRAVVVRMRRRAPTEQVEPWRRRVHAPQAVELRGRISAWASRVIDDVRDAWPEMPAGIQDRDADVWEALLAVADAAGGAWPERARAAAVTLVTQSKESTPSLGVRLLADLRKVFGDAESLHTETVLSKLHNLDEAPWGDLRGKPLDHRGLANRLRPYDIKPKLVRIGSTVSRGYTREDLHDAWLRYLPASPERSVTSVTSVTDVLSGVNERDCVCNGSDDGMRYTSNPVRYMPTAS